MLASDGGTNLILFVAAGTGAIFSDGFVQECKPRHGIGFRLVVKHASTAVK